MVTELKPSTANSKIFPASSSAGTASGVIGSSTAATSDFVLKVHRWRSADYSPDAEATGDGDSVVKFINSGWLYNDTVLIGVAVASSAIGIANLIDSSNNPTSATVTLLLSSDREITRTFLVRRIEIDWNYRAEATRVTMYCRMTGTTTASIES